VPINDEQVEQLLERYAAEVSADELERLIEPETRKRLERCALIQARQSRVRRRIIKLAVGVAGLAAAACLLLVFYPRAAVSIDAFSVSTLRGSDRAPGEMVFDVRLATNHPAYVRIVLIDDRHEPWIMPFGGSRSDTAQEYVRHVKAPTSWTLSAQPNPKHPKAKAIFAMVIASKGEAPSTDALLKVIPDPVAPAEADLEAVRQALERMRDDLEKRFKGCVVEFRPIP
jgi:hypothetical protein